MREIHHTEFLSLFAMVSRHLDTNCVGRIGIVQYKASIGMNRGNCMANLTQEKLEWLLYCKIETSCCIQVQTNLGFCRILCYACIGFFLNFYTIINSRRKLHKLHCYV